MESTTHQAHSMTWQAKEAVLRFPRPTVVMGILNVTPDSFSDGGRFLDPSKAVDQGLAMAEEGAEIIDIGGESTRPGADPVAEDEELARVVPVIEGLKRQLPPSVLLSIDTMKPAVARAALESGASIVNDVGASLKHPEMAPLLRETGAGYVLMHMQGQPQTMQEAPKYGNVISDVGKFLGDRLKDLSQAGVHPRQVVLDVGIGFGKSLDHNLQLLAGLDRFKRWERPLLLGVSRKSFIGKVTGSASPSDRLAGSLACSALAVQSGVAIIRTHDVRDTWQAVRLTDRIVAARSNTSRSTDPDAD